MEIKDRKIVLLKKIDLTGGLFSIMNGFEESAEHHRGIVKNVRTGAGVEMWGDLALSEFHFWADDITICPEFFIPIHVSSGETLVWKRVYRFFAGSKRTDTSD